MRECWHRDRLHVVGRDEVATVQERATAGELEDRERPARARADLDRGRRPGRRDDVDDVVADRLGDVDALERALELEQLLPVNHRAEDYLVRLALHAPLDDLPLLVPARVADPDPEQEPVELRLRERIGALVLDRVLRREHEERPVERARHALDSSPGAPASPRAAPPVSSAARG